MCTPKRPSAGPEGRDARTLRAVFRSALSQNGSSHGRKSVVLPFLLLILTAVWFGCSPQRDYKTLSVFFDGVPDPNAKAKLVNGDEDEFGPRGEVVKSIMHKPYADAMKDMRKCSVCHGGDLNTKFDASFDDFTKLPSTICLKCHGSIPREYPIMHGPVANAQCLWCHDPHESTNPGILRMKMPAVCMQCHTGELAPSKRPEHTGQDINCVSCHNPHGGMKQKFIRVATVPTTAPTRGVVR